MVTRVRTGLVNSGLVRWLAPLAAIALVVCSAGVSGMVFARPPEPDPIPSRWEFDIDLGKLRLAYVSDAQGETKAYFYLTYTVTNNTGEDRTFTPQFDLVVGEGDPRQSGLGVPPRVTETLKARLDNPFLEDQVEVLGTLLQGREHAKDSLAIWPAQDLISDELVVYATGFSGESKMITFEDPESGEEREFLLRKTLMVRYDAPGNLSRLGDRPLAARVKRWIMR